MKRNRLFPRMIAGALCAVMLAGTLTGCGQKNSTVYYNDVFQVSGMKTISGENFDTEKDNNCFYLRSLGAGVIFTDLLREKKTTTRELQVSMVKENGLVFGYDVGLGDVLSGSQSAEEDLNQVMSFCTKLEDAPYEHDFLLSGIWRDDETSVQSDFEEFKSHFSHVEKMLSQDGYAYYYAWNDTFDTSKLDDEQKDDFNAVVKDTEGLKKNLCFFTPEKTESGDVKFSGSFKDFTAVDTQGNSVDQDVFKDYDLTMVYVWSANNAGCIEEMRELERLQTMLPENANLLSICADGSDAPEKMNQILSENNCGFQTLVDGNSLNGAVLNNISMYPTTLFVDNEGNVVGQPQIGTPGTQSDLGDMAEMMGDDVVIGAVPNYNGDNTADGDIVSGAAGQDDSNDGFIIMGEDSDMNLSDVDLSDTDGDCEIIGGEITAGDIEDANEGIAERYLNLITKYLGYLEILK